MRCLSMQKTLEMIDSISFVDLTRLQNDRKESYAAAATALACARYSQRRDVEDISGLSYHFVVCRSRVLLD